MHITRLNIKKLPPPSPPVTKSALDFQQPAAMISLYSTNRVVFVVWSYECFCVCEVEATLIRCYIKFVSERVHCVKFCLKNLNVPVIASFPLPLSIRAIRLVRVRNGEP
jgi:hypothetical protein